MTSSTFSFMIFLVLLIFSIHMDEALGAQTRIRKLKETIKIMNRNMKGNDYKNSKMGTNPSTSPHCPGSRRFKNIVTTNIYQGADVPFTCLKCVLGAVCLSCTYIKHCQLVNGSTLSCSYKEQRCSKSF